MALPRKYRERKQVGPTNFGRLTDQSRNRRKSSLLHGLWLIAEQKYKYIETGWGMGQRILRSASAHWKRAEVSEPVGGKSRTNLEVGGQDCEYLYRLCVDLAIVEWQVWTWNTTTTSSKEATTRSTDLLELRQEVCFWTATNAHPCLPSFVMEIDELWTRLESIVSIWKEWSKHGQSRVWFWDNPRVFLSWFV